MIALRRGAILLAWSGAAVIVFGLLMFVFTFGDCRAEDFDCRQRQAAAGNMVMLAVSVAYGIGLGVMLQRWLLARKRA